MRSMMKEWGITKKECTKGKKRGHHFHTQANIVGGMVLLWLLLWVSISCGHATSSGYLNHIPEPLISLESAKNNAIVIVEKSSQQLFLYQYDGRYKEVFKTSCSTGKVAGYKTEAGDKKTPEGIYFCTQEFSKRELSPIYGSRAFPIDYPNYLDRKAGRNGSAIWLHGTNKQLKRRDSNGCVALNNADIDRLSRYILLNRTPVILVDKLAYISSNDDHLLGIRSAVTEFLDQWTDAYNAESVSDYVQYFDRGCEFDTTFWTDWVPVRERLDQMAGKVTVGMKNLSVYRHGGVYVALFDQIVTTPEQAGFVGVRKLYLKPSENTFKIIGDEFQALPGQAAKKAHPAGHPLIIAGTRLERQLVTKQEIKTMIEGWLSAWCSKDAGRYGSYYARNFRFMGMNRTRYLAYKRQLNRKYDYINVSIDHLVISAKRNRSTATFLQTYKSSGLCDIGSKKLLLTREGGTWKILREIWKEK